MTGHRISSLDKSKDSLFTASASSHPPAWAKYLDPHVPTDLKALLSTASASAVILLEASERVFAITFGQGRHLLRADSFEQDFGLKVVLNAVAPDQLKSIDAKTIDETTVHTRRDLSHDSPFAAFDLDPSRDLLRAVTGSPKDEALAHRLTGADALGLQTREQVPDLVALCKRLLVAYEDTAYKESFDFIDFLRPVKSKVRREELDLKLVDALAAREIDDVHLAVPETLDWLDIDGFRYETDRDVDQVDKDPRISAYLGPPDDDEDGDADQIDLARLKADRLVAVRASDEAIANTWPIYRCLVYQVELEDSLYVLSTGDWFRIDKDYRDRVESEVEALKRREDLPAAQAGTDEDTYNKEAAAAIDALCLDKQLIYDGGPDKMEVCDLLTREGGFIHVKLRGSSSTLSHLFAQGTNSAERLLLDEGFREKARAMISGVDADFAEVIPSERPAAADHEIVFAVITRSERETPLTLPFFSVVSLRAAANRLRAYGFPVSVAEIHEG